ncbi:MAG: Stk1 family PASTA domain-containing Ser/Thr kinase [Clostridia bacterium]
MDNMINSILAGRYQINAKIGSGGSSIVYKALDMQLNRDVTIKILREQFSEDENSIKLFLTEAQSVAKLSHPNIVSLFDAGSDKGNYFLVMEYIDGPDLKTYIKNRPTIDIDGGLNLMEGILKALDHSHNSGVVHRDIKPQNILLKKDGTVKVTDFGISKIVTSATVTFAGSMIGSVQYISPEQARGGVTNQASDIYSAGVVFYELMTGQLPFQADTAIGIAVQHMQSDFILPSEINPEVTEEIETIIVRALDKNPQNRCTSAREMLADIEQVKENRRKNLGGQVGASSKLRMESKTVKELRKGSLQAKERAQNTVKKRIIMFIGLALLLVIIALGTKCALDAIFNAGEVTMPNVVNMPVTEAVTKLEALKLEVKLEESDLTDVEPSIVLEQDPEEGQVIKEGRIVTLVVSKDATALNGNATKSMPNLLSLTEAEAKDKLSSEGFTGSITVNKEFSESVAAGSIMAQNPTGGVSIIPDANITLTISEGKTTAESIMPDLVGLTLENSKKVLETFQLKIGTVKNEPNNTYTEGQVISQSVPAEQKVLAGDTINLVISAGPTKEKNGTVEFQVSAPDDALHTIRILVEDGINMREIYNQQHLSGDYITQNFTYTGKAVITVMMDDVPVLQQVAE